VDIEGAGHHVFLDGLKSTQIFIVQGGDLNITGITIENGGVSGTTGSSTTAATAGINGVAGSNGGAGASGSGASGGAGTDGFPGTAGGNATDATSGGSAKGGAIEILSGIVFLKNDTFSSDKVTGGNGGNGAAGGMGGKISARHHRPAKALELDESDRWRRSVGVVGSFTSTLRRQGSGKATPWLEAGISLITVMERSSTSEKYTGSRTCRISDSNSITSNSTQCCARSKSLENFRNPSVRLPQVNEYLTSSERFTS